MSRQRQMTPRVRFQKTGILYLNRAALEKYGLADTERVRIIAKPESSSITLTPNGEGRKLTPIFESGASVSAVGALRELGIRQGDIPAACDAVIVQRGKTVVIDVTALIPSG